MPGRESVHVHRESGGRHVAQQLLHPGVVAQVIRARQAAGQGATILAAVHDLSLAGALAESFTRARADLVLYIAGADPYHGDRLGRLALTKPGLLERDRMVLGAARRAGTPLAIVCGGGYCADLASIVDIHSATSLAAAGAV